MKGSVDARRPARLGRLTRFAAIAISLAAFATPGPALAADLPAHAESSFGCGKYMTSDATYFPTQNRVVGVSTLTNNCQALGFHSAVVALISDANGWVVGYGVPHRYGIDARGLCLPFVGCPPTRVRREPWQDDIDPRAAATAAQLTLVQDLSPNSLLDSLQSFRAYLDQVVAIGEQVGKVVAVIQSF